MNLFARCPWLSLLQVLKVNIGGLLVESTGLLKAFYLAHALAVYSHRIG